MSYATVTDLQERLGLPRLTQLTDLSDPPVGLPDNTVAQRALDDAAAEIDGYLVGRYPLPLAAVPGVLKVHAVSIAHYRLLGSAADENERKVYEGVLRFLGLVAKGDVLLMQPADVPQPAGVGSVVFETGAKVMGRESAAESD